MVTGAVINQTSPPGRDTATHRHGHHRMALARPSVSALKHRRAGRTLTLLSPPEHRPSRRAAAMLTHSPPRHCP